MAIIDTLKALKEESVSDIFLTEGKAPMVRRLGTMEKFDGEVLHKEDFLTFFEDHLPPDTWQNLSAKRDLDLGLSLSVEERFRLNLGFEQGAISLIARKVPSGAMRFDELDLPEVVEALAKEPRGLILITGSTGSGKSTTMAAMLHYMNSHYPRHIVTIEDPIEFVHRDDKSHITQREIGSDTRNFSAALRAVVRQSPDVIFIGELRDMETIQTAIAAAMTGHLVVSTLHTIDAEQTLERMLNYVPEGQRQQFALDLSLALKGIVSQRLLPHKDMKGMVPAVECLINTPHVAKLIASQQIEEIGEAIKAGGSKGMISFNRTLMSMVKREDITPETAIASSDKPEELRLLMQGMETGIDTLRAGSSEEGMMSTSMKSLLKAALHFKASDMLISAGNSPVLRVNGELLKTDVKPLSSTGTRNLLFSLLTRRQRAEFEQKKEIDFALSATLPDGRGSEHQNRFRVNGFYQKGSVSCAIRVINQTIPSARDLGLPQAILNMNDSHHGLVLITGPTGQGKSTTLACMIDRINASRSCHVITIEDPIEYVHQNKKAIIEQRELHSDTLSYNHAMKYVLRQDPDVILIGEMRDPETIAAALTAAETGHLVLATLHTNDAVQTIDRIIDSFPAQHQNQIRSQLSACLVGVVAQRLLPMKDKEGRVAVFEILKGTAAIKANIRDAKTHQIKAAMETSAKDGMITMDKALMDLYDRGVISRQTVKSVASDKNII